MSDVLPSPVISFNTLETTDQKSPLPTSQASSPCGSNWTYVPLNTYLHNYIIIAHPIILATLRKPLEIRWKFARNSQLMLGYICLIYEIVYFIFNPAGEWCVLLFCDETMTLKAGRIHSWSSNTSHEYWMVSSSPTVYSQPWADTPRWCNYCAESPPGTFSE